MRKEIPEHRRNTVDSLAVEQKAKKDAQKAKRVELEKKEWKRVRNIILIFVLAVGFYFLASPYQNCLRETQTLQAEINVAYCAERTGW